MESFVYNGHKYFTEMYNLDLQFTKSLIPWLLLQSKPSLPLHSKATSTWIFGEKYPEWNYIQFLD